MKNEKYKQSWKSNIFSTVRNKYGQEEMVGFALIMILVAVILLIFVGFSLKDSQKDVTESYEVESFIQAFLQYTTDCADGYEPRYYSVGKLITACNNGERCLDERDTCEVLELTLGEITGASWKVGENLPVKGYELKILSNNKDMMIIQKGNFTENSRGAVQYLKDIEIFFITYY
jgi:hypothetical protein